ncbi:MAG: AzlD domain-containing protein [Synergistaceae bacterium]|jgi:branched-subunit amino acid transport protein|nr:AzlD domain-containing protein [Synergistaceae bacterium]
MNRTWAIIAGMTLVTLIPRIVPLLTLPGMKMPRAVERWFGNIAPAILAALLLPELLLDRAIPSSPTLSASNPYLLASLPAFLVAWKTKNLFAAVMAGILALAAIRAVMS